ncbi:MAG: TfoX/Sxy family protein [Pirellulales bacterium]|nr:TfoX/Sxy family protein [Pirellulales bacterium]
MPPLDDRIAEVLARLRLLPRVTVRKMFGGAGLYCQGVIFGLIADGRLYFRVDEESRGPYEAAGMSFFVPWPEKVINDKPQHAMRSYYEVPPRIERSPEELCQWASTALAIAQKNSKVRKKSTPKRKNANNSSRTTKRKSSTKQKSLSKRKSQLPMQIKSQPRKRPGLE